MRHGNFITVSRFSTRLRGMEGEEVNDGFAALDIDEESLWVCMDNGYRFERGSTPIDFKTRAEPDLTTIVPGFATSG